MIAFVSVGLAGASLLTPLTASAGDAPVARFDRPFEGFASSRTVLTDSTPAAAGLDAGPIEDALTQIAGWEEPSGSTRPLYAGAVTVLGHDGHVVSREASGYALRYADGAGTELPREQWVPMRQDTIFDMASVSKLFTSILVVQQIERGAIRLEEPVATYLPAFGADGKGAITVRQLLTHTSGLKPWMPLWSGWPDKASRIQAVMDVAPTSPPGTTYVYSDLNLITLGVLLERQTGSGLDQLVRERITAPLRMRDTGYNPDPRCGRGSPRPSSRPARPGGWSGGRSTTRTRGPSVGSPVTPGSSRRHRTWRCSPRPCSTEAPMPAIASCRPRASRG